MGVSQEQGLLGRRPIEACRHPLHGCARVSISSVKLKWGNGGSLRLEVYLIPPRKNMSKNLVAFGSSSIDLKRRERPIADIYRIFGRGIAASRKQTFVRCAAIRYWFGGGSSNGRIPRLSLYTYSIIVELGVLQSRMANCDFKTRMVGAPSDSLKLSRSQARRRAGARNDSPRWG